MATDCKKTAQKALCLVGLGILACAIVHRRVIAATLTGKPLPEPPAWHVWHKGCQK